MSRVYEVRHSTGIDPRKISVNQLFCHCGSHFIASDLEPDILRALVLDQEVGRDIREVLRCDKVTHSELEPAERHWVGTHLGLTTAAGRFTNFLETASARSR